jgi:toxin ParE1/3/4
MAVVRLSTPAEQDIDDIWRWSSERFGEAAAGRYRRLIWTALRDLAANPRRAGSQLLPGDPDAALQS